MSKVIITCAVTGSIHTLSMSPALPVTAEEIAEAAFEAAEVGAAIVHLQAHNPIDGRPDQSPKAFEPFLRSLKQRSKVVINLTTGGSPYMSVEERIRPAAVWKPEVASLNMGSRNFGLFPMLKRCKTFRHDREVMMPRRISRPRIRKSLQGYSLCTQDIKRDGRRYESIVMTPAIFVVCATSILRT